jgi:hypothetical protein
MSFHAAVPERSHREFPAAIDLQRSLLDLVPHGQHTRSPAHRSARTELRPMRTGQSLSARLVIVRSIA